MNSLLELFFPRLCIACHQNLLRQEKYICTPCEQAMPYTHFSFLLNNPIKNIFAGRLALEAASALLHFTKGEIVQSLLHRLKYQHEPEIAKWAAAALCKQQENYKFLQQIDLIVPVPIHPKKQKKRGYNQSEVFGNALSEILKIPLKADVLIKSQHTDSQTKKGRYSRWQNINESFEIKDQNLQKYSHILLIDDVVTTGATLEKCASLLCGASNAKISIATIAAAVEF